MYVAEAAYERAVPDIYKARSEIVHAGSGALVEDLTQARQAFSLAFAKLAARIERLGARSFEPIAELTGDT